VLLAILVIGCFIVLKPFLVTVLWALILALSTWPTFRWLERRLGGRRTLAALIVTLGLVAALLVPLIIVGTSVADDISRFSARAREFFADGLPPTPPEWLAGLPVAGPDLAAQWTDLAEDTDRLADLIRQHIPAVRDWLLRTAGALTLGLLELALSLIIAFIFLRQGPAVSRRLGVMVDKLTGHERGQHLLAVAQGTLKGVVYGIIGTALAQGVLTVIGLWMAGVPSALFLGVVAGLLSVLPFGPGLIWLPAAIWLFNSGETGWGIFLLLWGALVVNGADNIIKPYFIGRGSALPLLLVFLGIFGGAIAFGFLGIFLGPTLLAVAYSLFVAWTSMETGRPPVAEGAVPVEPAAPIEPQPGPSLQA
jgi:predicted PurR-regulated permease PerM